VFTIYALKVERLDIAPDSDLNGFAAAALPVAIDTASFVAVYGPARKPLPTPEPQTVSLETTGGTHE
jgi:hypothetical protein